MSSVISHPTLAIRIGTRKSPLAMAQAHLVKRLLESAHPGIEATLVPMMTSGDRFLAGPLSEIGGKGLFTKEIEDALFDDHIDIAVHSIKDMQTVLPADLTLACVLEREDARDVLISRSGAKSLSELPQGCVMGTASLRRGAQVRNARPDIAVGPLRGNVQTRLSKVEAGEYDATLLAAAGLKRLGLSPMPGHMLSVEEMLPAAAQGAIGLECREEDETTRALLAPLNHDASMHAIICERALLRALDGSCRTPIAAYAEVEGKALRLRAMLLSDDGTKRAVTEVSGNVADAVSLGMAAGKRLRVAF